MTSNVHCVELEKFAVPGMRIKVRWFPDGVSNKQVWRAPSNILSLSRVVGGPVLHRNVSKDSPNSIDVQASIDSLVKSNE
jgi:hypothetical protein